MKTINPKAPPAPQSTTVTTVHFEDHGQDFLEFDITGQVVTECRPFQAWVWEGAKVHNRAAHIAPGHKLLITTKGMPESRLELNYPITKVTRRRGDRGGDEMSEVTKYQALRDLAGEKCACGILKHPMTPFCRECFLTLETPQKDAIMNHHVPVAESYGAALAYLGLESPAARADRIHAAAIREGMQIAMYETRLRTQEARR
jgi:hypothetical protein